MLQFSFVPNRDPHDLYRRTATGKMQTTIIIKQRAIKYGPDNRRSRGPCPCSEHADADRLLSTHQLFPFLPGEQQREQECIMHARSQALCHNSGHLCGTRSPCPLCMWRIAIISHAFLSGGFLEHGWSRGDAKRDNWMSGTFRRRPFAYWTAKISRSGLANAANYLPIVRSKQRRTRRNDNGQNGTKT